MGKRHKKALEEVLAKEKITAVFFLLHESVWKYSGLYKLMEKDDRFEPIIVICPDIQNGGDSLFDEMNESYKKLKAKNYNVTLSYDNAKGSWSDVKKEIKPDMVFFTNPNNITRPEYQIENFLDTLTFYVPYGFMITERPEMQYDKFFHNVTFRIFQETSFQQEQAKLYARNKGINSVVTGYPGIDDFLLSGEVNSKKSSEAQNKNLKRVIWAPHHTVEKEESKYNYSTFLEYHQLFIDLTQKYKDQIEFIFKPHPILKSKLTKLESWGKQKTEDYYNYWKNSSLCRLCEGDYTNLFLNSDAMIHDSGSFLVEYISTNKPSLYMIRHEVILEGFSDLGNKIIDCHYKSFQKSEVINFIENVVLNDEDYLRDKREKMIEHRLKPPGNKSASENIYEDICRLITHSK